MEKPLVAPLAAIFSQVHLFLCKMLRRCRTTCTNISLKNTQAKITCEFILTYM